MKNHINSLRRLKEFKAAKRARWGNAEIQKKIAKFSGQILIDCWTQQGKAPPFSFHDFGEYSQHIQAMLLVSLSKRFDTVIDWLIEDLSKLCESTINTRLEELEKEKSMLIDLKGITR